MPPQHLRLTSSNAAHLGRRVAGHPARKPEHVRATEHRIETLLVKQCRAWVQGNGVEPGQVSCVSASHVEEPIPAAVSVRVDSKYWLGSYNGQDEPAGVAWLKHGSDLQLWAERACTEATSLDVVRATARERLERPEDLLQTSLSGSEIAGAYRRAAFTEICQDCDTSGVVVCRPCDGRRIESCNGGCGGSGWVTKEEYYTEQNTDTSSYAPTTVTKSRTVSVPCSSCGGSGTQPCSYCRGRGVTQCDGCAGTGYITSWAEVRAYLHSFQTILTDRLSDDLRSWAEGQTLDLLMRDCVAPEPIEPDDEDREQWSRRLVLFLPASHVDIQAADEVHTFRTAGCNADILSMPPFLDALLEPVITELEQHPDEGDVITRLVKTRVVGEALAASLYRKGHMSSHWQSDYIGPISLGVKTRLTHAADRVVTGVAQRQKLKGIIFAGILGVLLVAAYHLSGVRPSPKPGSYWIAALIAGVDLVVAAAAVWGSLTGLHLSRRRGMMREIVVWLEPTGRSVPKWREQRTIVSWRMRWAVMLPGLILLVAMSLWRGYGLW